MRFRREAQPLASLDHPSIASIFGLEESAGTLALALVDGENLAQRLARGAMPVGEAIARAMADGLDAAHSRFSISGCRAWRGWRSSCCARSRAHPVAGIVAVVLFANGGPDTQVNAASRRRYKLKQRPAGRCKLLT